MIDSLKEQKSEYDLKLVILALEYKTRFMHFSVECTSHFMKSIMIEWVVSSSKSLCYKKMEVGFLQKDFSNI